jgi:hypothetical protein
MIDWTKPIETMEGWKAKVVSTDYKTISSTLYLVQMERPSGASILGWYREDGRPWETQTLLRNVKVKKEGWLNVFPNRWVGTIYESKEVALRHPNAKGALDTIKIEWEEDL